MDTPWVIPPGIKIFRLALPFRLGRVNCYLIRAEAGFVLIDTGCAKTRARLETELEHAGCRSGNLRLIVITHGDFDHTGAAAYLRNRFGTQIAMHPDDFGMAERGEMFSGRRAGRSAGRKKGYAAINRLAAFIFGFGKSERFHPDLSVEDGFDLRAYGVEAWIVALPGHSRGSIGVLTIGGELFCGDLFENTIIPAINSIMDDRQAAKASVEKLNTLGVKTIYPGHGAPFSLEQFLTIYAGV